MDNYSLVDLSYQPKSSNRHPQLLGALRAPKPVSYVPYDVDPHPPTHARQTAWEHVLSKTNRIWDERGSYAKAIPKGHLCGSEDGTMNAYPAAYDTSKSCSTPEDEPSMMGLNRMGVVDAQNLMRLYNTYTVAPGEFDARYVHAQL